MSTPTLLTLPRETFRAAIADGIKQAELSEAAAARLLDYAETATEAAFGTFEDDATGCKCPLYATGLVEEHVTPEETTFLGAEGLMQEHQIGPFYSGGGYDTRIRRAMRAAENESVAILPRTAWTFKVGS